MIKLSLSRKPTNLTDELVAELTAKYKSDGSDVWNAKFIRDAVLAFSNSKCCYSECMLQEESKYMEVDHFYAKKHYPDRVVEWGNLLPSSKKCNTSKGEHDVSIEPIVSPFEDPKIHLYMVGPRYWHKTGVGKRTIEVVDLNNWLHFGKKRAKIVHEVSEIISEIFCEIEEDADAVLTNNRRQRKIIKRVKNLFEESSRENEYSATISTLILADVNYVVIEKFLVDNNLWDNELTELKMELIYCSLPK